MDKGDTGDTEPVHETESSGTPSGWSFLPEPPVQTEASRATQAPQATDRVVKFYSEKDEWGELSNFWTLAEKMAVTMTVLVDGKPTEVTHLVPTTEHAYQMAKFIYPNAHYNCAAYVAEIARANSPSKAKILGNQTTMVKYAWQKPLKDLMMDYKTKGVRPDPQWETRKVEAMRDVLFRKFRADERCRDALLSTNGYALQEVSPYDAYWGMGKTGTGQNMLGQLLQEVRDVLFHELGYRTLKEIKAERDVVCPLDYIQRQCFTPAEQLTLEHRGNTEHIGCADHARDASEQDNKRKKL